MCTVYIYTYIRIATIGSESEARVNPLSSLVLKARESKQVHVRHCPKRQIVQHQGPDLRTITATLLDYSDYTIFTRQRNWPDLMCRWCAMKSCTLKLALQTQLKTSFCKMRWSSVPPCTRGAIQSTCIAKQPRAHAARAQMDLTPIGFVDLDHILARILVSSAPRQCSSWLNHAKAVCPWTIRTRWSTTCSCKAILGSKQLQMKSPG